MNKLIDEEFRERERMIQDEYPGRRTACPGIKIIIYSYILQTPA